MIDTKQDKILAGVAALIGLSVLVVGASQLDFNEPDSTEEPKKDLTELPEPSNGTTIYFFWGDGCPHCAKEKPFLEELDKEYEGLEVKMYEVYYNKTNQKIYQNVAEIYGTSARGVPGTFLGEESWEGFREETIGNEIESKVEECLGNTTCKGPLS